MHNNFTICELYDKITLGGTMDKVAFLNELYNNIKDKIEFDSDILAIYRILIALLKVDIADAIKKWQYILSKYDINELQKDLDFAPLTSTFPTNLFQIVSLEEFYQILEETPHNQIIYGNIFNVFDNSSAIYIKINKLIINNEEEKEKEIIKTILQNIDYYPKTSFDTSAFLKNIILFHIAQPHKNIDLLLGLANLSKDIKEKSVLKTLLIDYL